MGTMVAAKQWQEMSKEERDEHITEQKRGALMRIKDDNFPVGVGVKIAGFTLTAKPVRETETGGVSYSLAPVILETSDGRYRIRVNKFSVSVLPPQSTSVPEADLGEGEIL